MLKEYKTSFLIKTCALLVILALSFGMTFGVTYCRYSTQRNIDVKYYAKSVPVIYMDSSKVNEETLIELSDWESTLNKTSTDFTLSNTSSDESAPQQDIRFCVRVCVEKTGEAQANNQPETLPIQITLSADEVSYRSEAFELSDETSFYKYTRLGGEFYTFSADDENTDEAVFCLKGGENSKIDFNVTVYNLQSEYQKVYLCIDRI